MDFQIFGQSISLLELIGTIFGIAGVWLTVRKNIWCFPVGIVNVVLYSILFFQSKLYGDASLQIIYIVLLVYGWFQWNNKKNPADEIQVSKSAPSLILGLIFICLVSVFSLWYFFKNHTDSTMPFPDALTTSMSLIAQWMIAKKKIENWLVWIVADVIYVFMYVQKNLYLTSVLYFIFIVLAIIGYFEWRKNLTDQNISVRK